MSSVEAGVESKADDDPRGGRPSVAAVVPARNEAGRIAATVAALRSIAEITEVVVIDDGSTDATAAEAAEAGARVVRLAHNQGKGRALDRGVAATIASVLLLVDGDLGSSAANLGVLLAPVLRGEADIAIAAPGRAERPSGFGLVEGVARWGIERLAGARMERPLSGQRAFTRGVVEATGSFARGFGAETAFTIDALRAGYRVIEVPCEFSHARTGRDPAGFMHRARQGAEVLRALASRRRRG